MQLSKRVHALSIGAVATILTGIVLFDIYEDWQVQGEPLYLTLAENSLPLVLSVTLFGAGYYLYQREDRLFVATVNRWTVIGVVGILSILGWVVGLQSFQSQFKPLIVISHTAIGGAIGGVLVGVTTARIQTARSEIKTERERWRSLFENDPAAIADVYLDEEQALIETSNPTFDAEFTLSGDDESRSLATVLTENGGDDQTVTEIVDAVGNETELETQIATKSAEESSHFRVRVVPYGIGTSERRAFVLFTDVTDLRETQQELEENVEQLEKSNERLQQFAYIASHDLQEPLRMVSSYMSLLESEYRDDLDEDAQEYIDFAVDGATRMQKMIDGLLEYSRVRTQGEEFTEVDANDVLSDTLHDLELRIQESDATVTHDDLPSVEADRNQLGQLFQNLVENAIDHGEDGLEVHVGSETRPDSVVFSITDDGPGIPESQQDKVFKLFQHGGSDSTGTGIGLAICDRIVSRHGGDIWVDSEAGDGTTFYFSIPR